MLFAGTAMELLGASITDSGRGHVSPASVWPTFTTVQGKRRIVGDVYGVTALFPEAVVGFMNKCGHDPRRGDAAAHRSLHGLRQ